MQVTVEVTHADIRDDGKKSCWTCPIALAIKRLVGDFMVSVGAGTAVIGTRPYKRAKCWYSELPKSADDFIRSFDTGLHVEPFSFPLDIPKQYLRAK